ncbi:MAG: histone deacetylase [Hyphomicrobiaceae bacterium]|nr:histone deacetylase [Hyphomicrobiaceae bacterium]
MRFFYPEIEAPPLPPGHRFPAAKYGLLRRLIEHEGILPAGALASSPMATREQLLTAHAEGYVDAVLGGTLSGEAQRRIGLPWSERLAQRSCSTVGGALAAAREALRSGLSGQLAGGTHHAHHDFGSGFCVFNDLAVTALTLLSDGSCRRIAVLDLDVHQGDGNASLLAGRPGMLVVGIQGERNFPFRRIPSDIDIELPDGTADRAYLEALADVLPAIEAHRPDLVLYLSGADPLAEDRLGRLSLTHDGLAERDRLVLEMCRRRGLPVSIAIGGGYAVPIDATVRGYANTFLTARTIFGL